MSKTLRTLRDETLSKLGDTIATPAASRVWGETEIEGYIKDGLRDFCYQTRIVWDMAYLDDLAYTGSYHAAWEKAYFITGHISHKQFKYNNEWEKDYAFSGSPLPAANHTNVDERDDFLLTTLVAAVEQVPDAFLIMDRVTWDGRKIDPIMSRKLQGFDDYYEVVRGQVFGYLQDKDGLRSFRKYKPPVTQSPYYWAVGKFGVLRGSSQVAGVQIGASSMHIDEWGIVLSTGLKDAPLSLTWDFVPPGALGDLPVQAAAVTGLSEFSGDTVVWRFGILRRLPGYFPANGPWGLVKKVSQDQKNTRIEFIRRPRVPTSATDIFDIPDHYLKYLRHYAMWMAYERKGVGQDPSMAAHYKKRYEVGIGRVVLRMDSVYKAKLTRFGGGGVTAYTPRPYARLPRNI